MGELWEHAPSHGTRRSLGCPLLWRLEIPLCEANMADHPTQSQVDVVARIAERRDIIIDLERLTFTERAAFSRR